jgi:hypothetical protein
MLILSPRHRRARHLLLRLERAAAEINPFLIVIAIGLAVLDAACLVALLDTGSFGAHLGAAGLAPAPCATAN